jgi:small subunit ribosomal protein S26e
MPKKRRNGGKNRYGRGSATAVRCSNCRRVVPKDKAIKRFVIRSLVEAAALQDITVASVYKAGQFTIPKVYIKTQYCVSCGKHSRLVKSRSPVNRKIRSAPERLRLGAKRTPPGKPARGVKMSARRLAIVSTWSARRK